MATVSAEELRHFVNLDDNDLLNAMKIWSNSDDLILQKLCSGLLDRKLFKIRMSHQPISEAQINSENPSNP